MKERISRGGGGGEGGRGVGIDWGRKHAGKESRESVGNVVLGWWNMGQDRWSWYLTL